VHLLVTATQAGFTPIIELGGGGVGMVDSLCSLFCLVIGLSVGDG
jgi:hypothetical protein